MSPVSWGDIFTLPLRGDRIMELRQPFPQFFPSPTQPSKINPPHASRLPRRTLLPPDQGQTHPRPPSPRRRAFPPRRHPQPAHRDLRPRTFPSLVLLPLLPPPLRNPGPSRPTAHPPHAHPA